ncbi:hypothetical protein ACOTJH_29125 [Achromobacter xylosoxidans]
MTSEHRCANFGAAFQGVGCPSCRLAAYQASALNPSTMAVTGDAALDDASPDLRPHLRWALYLIWISMQPESAKFDDALEALDAARDQVRLDLRPHLTWALRHIEKRLGIVGQSETYEGAVAALNAANAALQANRQQREQGQAALRQ